jgi:two-component system sensor histidine kinase RpfC
MLAADGEEALDAIGVAEEAGEAFHLVLMDVNMPGLDGIEATKLHRFAEMGSPQHLPILALTADATPETRSRCLEAGMDACITKPVEPGPLLEAMQRVLPGTATTPVAKVAEITSHPRFRASQPPALDPETLTRLQGLGGDAFVSELATDFLAEGTALLGQLASAVAARDPRQFRAHAHGLASISANIGARHLHTLCAAAQRLGPAELGQRGCDEAETIAREFERVQAALQEMRGVA